jgi:hypothetical protein
LQIKIEAADVKEARGVSVSRSWRQWQNHKHGLAKNDRLKEGWDAMADKDPAL